MTVRWRQWTTCVAMLGIAVAAAPVRAHAQAQGDSARALSLDDALRLAEQMSEDVVIARAGVERARGQQEKAHSQYLPQIYATASYTRTLKSQFEGFGSGTDSTSAPECSSFVPDSTAPVEQRLRLLERALGCSTNGGFGSFAKVGFGAANQYNLGLSLSQNLFAGGRLRAQTREANAARRAAEISLTSAQAQAMLTVVQAYYDAVLSDQLVRIAEATLAQADSTLAQTRLARQVGNQPEFELLRAQVTRDNQVPVVIQRRTERDQAYLRLKQLLKLPLTTDLTLTTGLGDTATVASTRLASLLETTPDTSVDARAPVRQALESVTSSRSAVTVARSQRIPTLTISSAYGKVAFPSSGVPNWNQFLTNWTITAQIQFPLFTGGSIHGDEVMARANLQEAEARARQTRQLAELDTRNALAQLATAQAQFAASVGTVEQAGRAYQIAEVRYREGISTQTELNDSRIQLQQAQANRAQAARDLQVARIRVALLRNLPLSNATQAAPTTQQMIPVQTTTPSQQVPRTQPSTTPQTGSVVQASQSGVTP